MEGFAVMGQGLGSQEGLWLMVHMSHLQSSFLSPDATPELRTGLPYDAPPERGWKVVRT